MVAGPAACVISALGLTLLTGAGLSKAGAAGEAGCPAAASRFEFLEVEAPELDRTKRILVYLPPGYDCTPSRRYPVIYVNDGQDLFDWNPFAAELDPALAAEIAAREAWYGSWRLDRQLDEAAAGGSLPPMIAVGIASDDGWRSRDLAPAPWLGSDEARGAAYARFVAGTVVPAIDGRYRTRAARGCRGMAGASLGAVSALQIGLAYPGLFAMVLALSPVLSDPALAQFVAAAWRHGQGSLRPAIVVDVDDDPPGDRDRAWLGAMTAQRRRPDRQLVVVQTPGGRHAIASWAERVVPGLRRLFLTSCSS